MRTGAKYAGLLGMAALFGALDGMSPTESRPISTARRQSWGNPKTAKVKRGRAKERAAKTARKINWN